MRPMQEQQQQQRRMYGTESD
eukprot:COSAG06_NODE_50431_length_318_cov_1.831050_2_plen_20_part_01